MNEPCHKEEWRTFPPNTQVHVFDTPSDLHGSGLIGLSNPYSPGNEARNSSMQRNCKQLSLYKMEKSEAGPVQLTGSRTVYFPASKTQLVYLGCWLFLSYSLWKG